MIKQTLDAYMANKSKPWLHDRMQTVGASEVGQCARKTAFLKHLDDPSSAVPRDVDYEDGWGARERGTIIEDNLFVPAVRARFGSSALFTGDEQRTFTAGYSSATPDGLLIDQPANALAHLGIADIEGDCILLDCKSIDPRARIDRPKDENVFQMQQGLGLVRETSGFKPMYALLSYIDASFLDQVTEFAVRFDEGVYQVGRSRARQIMTSKTGLDLRPEGLIAGGAECKYCPFTTQCGAGRFARVPAAPAPMPEEIAEKIRQEAELAKAKTADVEALEAEIALHKERIRDHLEAAGSRSLPGVVSWSAIKGRKGWDAEGLRHAAAAAGVDLSQFQKVGDSSDRLTLG